jgi:hypothetical protein
VYRSKFITHQFKKLKNKVKKGENKNKNLFALFGTIISLKINFKPSAKGCKIPKYPTTEGPLRLCTEAINFRSTKVKKATLNNKGIIVKILNIKQSK